MRFHVSLRLLTCALASTWALGIQCLRADDIPADRRLPPGVLLYLSCPSIPKLSEQVQDTSFSALVHDPALEDFRSQLIEKFEEFQEQAAEKLPIPLSDLAALFSGEVTGAVLRPVGQAPGAALFVDIGGHRDILDQIFAKAEESIEEGKIEKEIETIEGTQVTTCSLALSNQEDAEPTTFAYFVKDDMFVVTSALSIAESILTRWNGQHAQTFADTPVYKQIMAKCLSGPRASPALQWYVDPVALIATGLSMTPDTQLFAGMVYAPTFGLSNFKAIGGALEIATDEFDSVSRVLYYVNTPTSGVLKIFEFRPTVTPVPNWVPANATQYFGLDWNLKGAYEAIESIYDSFTGPGKFAATINSLAQQSGTGLNVKEDVINVLSGRFQGYFLPPEGGDPKNIQGVFEIGVTDAAKGQRLVDVALNAAGAAESTEYHGTKIHLVGDDRPVAVAIREKSIFISNSADLIKHALDNTSPAPLAKSDSFAAIQKLLPKEVCVFAYQNAAGQLAAGYEALREGKFDGLAEGQFDFSVLPPFEVISKYFSPSASYIVPDENGAMGVQFSLKRKE